MHIFESFEELINYEFLMDFLEDAGSDNDMQIYVNGVLPVSMKSKTK